MYLKEYNLRYNHEVNWPTSLIYGHHKKPLFKYLCMLGKYT